MQKNQWWTQSLKDILIFIGMILLLVFLNKCVFINALIPSESMEPTLYPGDLVFGNRMDTQQIARYDVIIFHYPDHPSEFFIKRVIGLPGETIVVKDGKVYANDVLLKDSFVKEKMNTSGDGRYQVPPDHYFMMGDNRNDSKDSRFWKNKYLSKDQVIATAVCRIIPNPSKLKL